MILSYRSGNRIHKAGTFVIDKSKHVIESAQGDIDLAVPDAVADGATDEERAQSVAASIIAQAKTQADELLRTTRMTAITEQDTILEKARADAKKILADAEKSGYKTGMDAATKEGNKIRAEANEVLQQARAERKALEEHLEPQIVDMIIGITQKLLSDTFRVNPAVIVNLVRQGLRATTGSGNITVFVSPEDYENTIAQRDALLAYTDGSARLEITKDHSLNPTDCIIETGLGDIDCSLDSQFSALKANLTYILRSK